ncbi:MAG: hypothetical protein KUG64_10415 [Cycloclasticus sp.]|nr:hypothetical protein [Cycloclasticus sp.]
MNKFVVGDRVEIHCVSEEEMDQWLDAVWFARGFHAARRRNCWVKCECDDMHEGMVGIIRRVDAPCDAMRYAVEFPEGSHLHLRYYFPEIMLVSAESKNQLKLEVEV